MTIFDNFENLYNGDKFGQFWQLFFTMFAIEKTTLDTRDIWDTDYSSDNWEIEFMTVFGNWQLIVTLDSIRNSCDVLFLYLNNMLQPVDNWAE